MCTIFEQLPRELLHLILSYDGTIKYRNGMYMNQWSKNDPRYDVLRTIKLPVHSTLTHHWIHEQPIRYTYSYAIHVPNLYTMMRGTDRRNMNFAINVNPDHETVTYSIYDASNAINQHYFIRT